MRAAAVCIVCSRLICDEPLDYAALHHSVFLSSALNVISAAFVPECEWWYIFCHCWDVITGSCFFPQVYH